MIGSGADGGTLEGSWDSGFWIDVPFPLRSKSNYRRGQASAGREWKTVQAFEEAVGLLARSQLPPDWVVGNDTLPVSGRPAVLVCIVGRSMLDTANFSKSVLDACERVVFTSDASVLGVVSLGIRVKADQRAVVGFAQMASQPNLGRLAELSGELGRATSSVADSVLKTGT